MTTQPQCRENLQESRGKQVHAGKRVSGLWIVIFVRPIWLAANCREETCQCCFRREDGLLIAKKSLGSIAVKETK